MLALAFSLECSSWAMPLGKGILMPFFLTLVRFPKEVLSSLWQACVRLPGHWEQCGRRLKGNSINLDLFQLIL